MLTKATVFILLLLCISTYRSSAQVSVYFNETAYNLPGEGPYLETHLRIPLSGLMLKETEGLYRAQANVSLVISQGSEIKYFDKYVVNSPAIDHPDMANFDLLDLKRVALANGEYVIELQVSDANDTSAPVTLLKKIDISMPENMIALSSPVLLDTIYPSSTKTDFTRGGYEMMPAVGNQFIRGRKNLTFYVEAYNTDKMLIDRSFVFDYYITDKDNNRIEGLGRQKTKKPSALVHLMDGLNITSLRPGTYVLHVDILNDKDNKLTGKEVQFVITTPEEPLLASDVTFSEVSGFKEYLSMLLSKEQDEELTSLIAGNDTLKAKEWFVSFWKARDAKKPKQAYKAYQNAVAYVNETFNSPVSKGYKSDMGRTFLRYGRPDNVTPFPQEPNAYEYEKWQYYHTGNQTNVFFIFYNPTQMPGDYVLLHSDMRGEISNPRWQQMIYRRTDKSRHIEDNASDRGVGSQLNDIFQE